MDYHSTAWFWSFYLKLVRDLVLIKVSLLCNYFSPWTLSFRFWKCWRNILAYSPKLKGVKEMDIKKMLIHDHYKVFTQRKYSIIVSGTKKLLPANMFEVLENEIPSSCSKFQFPCSYSFSTGFSNWECNFIIYLTCSALSQAWFQPFIACSVVYDNLLWSCSNLLAFKTHLKLEIKCP